ncbi:sigma-70 family RNA polymerase sigma factor [bacterium]|nr:sigma-70 family RNA polymerase sigma factor [bacterium]HPF34668.1 sigma-70 family RNA polymerase sigma factor [Candidatus Krumholzibacteria bacterium]HRX51738.1 sigma-70 family RNA polymerase sigma factor [Candidatus Krumholzibacteria bacterium]
MQTDEQLVERARSARQGDLRAFDELVRRHQAKVRTNCRYLTGSEEDALDLSQEVFVKAYFNLKRFEGRSSFGTWVQRIKVNHCLNHIRKRRGKTFVDVEDPALAAEDALRDGARADDATRARETRERIGEVLDRMSETLRVPLLLRDLDGLSYQEIADRLDLGLSAVKMRIARAREEFRELYDQG